MSRRIGRFFGILTLAAIGGIGPFTPTALGQADLLVSDVGKNTVLRIDGVTGASKGSFISFGSAAQQAELLLTPFGMAFGPDGNLYLSSLGTGSILRFNGSTGAYMNTVVPRGTGGLNFPNQIAFGPDGNLYVSSYSAGPNGQGQVLSYNTSGTFLRSFSAPNLLGPTGLTFGGGNSSLLYVSSSLGTGPNATNASIFRFDTGVSGSQATGTLFANDPNLQRTAGLSVDTAGNIVAANFNGTNSSITRYAQGEGTLPAGTPLETAFIRTTIDGLNVNDPVVAAFSATTAFVSSYSSNAIYRFNASTGAALSTLVAANSGILSQPTYLMLLPPGAGLSVTVPEPAGLALLGLGSLGLFGYTRTRVRAARVATA